MRVKPGLSHNDVVVSKAACTHCPNPRNFIFGRSDYYQLGWMECEDLLHCAQGKLCMNDSQL